MKNASLVAKLGMSVGMLWAFLLPTSAYDFEVDGIFYNITSQSNLEVEVTYPNFADCGYPDYGGDIVIPENVNYNNRTYTVTSIGYEAFSDAAIYDEPLTSVTLPNSIRKIGNNAFMGCPQLKSIDFPESLEEIGSHAFLSCSIQSIVIGKNISTIGYHAFRDCDKLLKVFCLSNRCPSGLSTDTFYECQDSIEIFVPSVEEYGFGIEYITFSNHTSQYTGMPYKVEWTNNLKDYNCRLDAEDTKQSVGTYSTTFSATYSNGIDITVEIPYSYEITPAPLTLSVNDCQREYGEENPAFTCSISGFVNGENEQTLGSSVAFECEANSKSTIGTYPIRASLNAPNYEITYDYGALTVLKAPLNTSIVNTTKTYGNLNPEFTLSYAGLKNGETAPTWNTMPRIQTAATEESPAGQYPITATGGDPVNYELLAITPGTLTVLKRDLTVKANDCDRLYGEENPSFEISYIGFVNNDTESSLTASPTAECTADKESNVGTYPITVSGGQSDNYNFVYQDGLLTVNPLSVGFKDIYNSVTYNDTLLSTSSQYFNYIPEIIGPFSEDDFWIELWFLDKEGKYPLGHIYTVTSGDYAGDYVNTNYDRTMWAGKYIVNLVSKGTNPNVIANPSRAYLTVNRASNNLEWDIASPIIIGVGDTVDLGISYQADLWCTFNTDYDAETLSVFSDNETSNHPHWYAVGLKEGNTTLSFSIECRKNDLGFYDFSDSRTITKNIIVKSATGIGNIQDESDGSFYATDGRIFFTGFTHVQNVEVYSPSGILEFKGTTDDTPMLHSGVHLMRIANRTFKILID